MIKLLLNFPMFRMHRDAFTTDFDVVSSAPTKKNNNIRSLAISWSIFSSMNRFLILRLFLRRRTFMTRNNNKK